MRFKPGQKVWNTKTGKAGSVRPDPQNPKTALMILSVSVETEGYDDKGDFGRANRDWVVPNCQPNKPKRKKTQTVDTYLMNTPAAQGTSGVPRSR